MNEVEAIGASLNLWAIFVPVIIIGIPVVWLMLSKWLRVTVRPNEVHIVQSAKRRTTYGGADSVNNVYWAYPEWIPFIGVEVAERPLAVFDIELPNYEAYDKDKVPFMVDVNAFFRIINPDMASERVESMPELEKQLLIILKGAIRKVLAMHDVEKIMVDRATFGELFTKETTPNLAEWGIGNAKSIELMDVRDAPKSETISNIMAKRESGIEKESRVEVAGNKRDASKAEIEAQRVVDVAEQEAEQKVGERTAEKDQQVGVANETAKQAIKEQAKLTATKDMAVKEVNDVRSSEIAKKVRVVQAEETKQVDIVEAEGQKQQTVLVAEGTLTQQELAGKGILAVGTAEAEAKKLGELATVNPQLTLAEGIGANEQYQDYMVRIREVEKNEAVGVEQAKALKEADLKVIANTGEVTSGVTNIMDIFSPKGGTALAGMAEAFAQSETGKDLIGKVVGK
jgi:flotillin